MRYQRAVFKRWRRTVLERSELALTVQGREGLDWKSVGSEVRRFGHRERTQEQLHIPFDLAREMGKRN